MKSKVDKLDVDKLVTVPDDLSKLSDVVKNDVVKKDLYNDKIKDNLATTTALYTEINEVKGKVPNITNLAITNAITAVENEICNISNLVKETDYKTKTNEIGKKIFDNDHDKYVTTQVKIRKFCCKINTIS